MSETDLQDAKDGASLRRLRDVLSKQAPRLRGYTLDLVNDGSFYLSVRVEGVKIVGARGATIAEAADICEASLSGTQD